MYPEKNLILSVNKRTSCRFLIFIKFTFKESKNKNFFYSGFDCMEKICKILKSNIQEVINFEQEKMLQLSPEEFNSYLKFKNLLYM